MAKDIIVYKIRFAIDVEGVEGLDMRAEIWDVLRGFGELQIDERTIIKVKEDAQSWLIAK